MDLLLDTNVIIDYLGKRDPFYQPAMKIIAAGYFGDAKLWLSAQTPLDAFYVLRPRSSSEAVQEALLALYEVATPVSLGIEDFARGARLKWADYEDCMVAQCAVKVGADYIVTRDVKGFARSSVPTILPTELLKAIERDRNIEYAEVPFKIE